MRKYRSEQQVLDALQIPDWRHMSKDKIMGFASQLPYMDPEVAKAALAQFPEFSNLSVELVKQIKENLETIISKEKDVDSAILNQDRIIIDNLLSQLAESSDNEKQKYIDAIIKIQEDEKEFASQHRKDMFNHFLAICATISAISASAAAAIGAATALKNNDTSNDT